MKKEKKDPEKAHFFKAAIPAILFGIYVILDYLNVPQLLGLSSDRINMDFFDVFLNSVIVIVLYIITYFFVDSRFKRMQTPRIPQISYCYIPIKNVLIICV